MELVDFLILTFLTLQCCNAMQGNAPTILCVHYTSGHLAPSSSVEVLCRKSLMDIKFCHMTITWLTTCALRRTVGTPPCTWQLRQARRCRWSYWWPMVQIPLPSTNWDTPPRSVPGKTTSSCQQPKVECMLAKQNCNVMFIIHALYCSIWKLTRISLGWP